MLSSGDHNWKQKFCDKEVTFMKYKLESLSSFNNIIKKGLEF